MHITEDFAEFNEINKKRRGETSFLSVKTLMLNERKIGQIVQQSLHEIAKKY